MPPFWNKLIVDGAPHALDVLSYGWPCRIPLLNYHLGDYRAYRDHGMDGYMGIVTCLYGWPMNYRNDPRIRLIRRMIPDPKQSRMQVAVQLEVDTSREPLVSYDACPLSTRVEMKASWEIVGTLRAYYTKY